MKSWKQPTDEMVEKVLSSVKKETDRKYFFSKLTNPMWVGPLRERGFFSHPPSLRQLPDGYVQYPHWPELSYLVGIAQDAPDQVVEIILSLPKTDNPRVYEDILEAAIRLRGRKSAELLPKIREYIALDNLVNANNFPELIIHWTSQGNIDEALEVTRLVIPFREDSRMREKQELRRMNPNSLDTSLNPTPCFRTWEYQKILDSGVRYLSEHEPFKTSLVLIDAVTSMIKLGFHQDDLDRKGDQDYSEIWCRRLDKPDEEVQDEKEILVHALTNACKEVYNNDKEVISDLDQELRYPRWRIFKRIRQHLYSSNPNDQTLPWIREEILDHEEYSKYEHHYEFQLMIRKASEHFGHALLSESELRGIVNAIMRGPSQDEFREWMGDEYSEAVFRQRKSYFHRIQLRPFAAILTKEAQQYYEELECDASTQAITDECYSPYGEVVSGTISYRSPRSAEDLANITDEELITYINDWEEEYRDKENWLVEINVSALAEAFRSVFKERIVLDADRLDFWLANRDRIARPIYITAMLKTMVDLVSEMNYSNLLRWIEFCVWVLTHPDTPKVEGQPEPRDGSSSHPDWANSRRTVVDFVNACVSQDADVPIEVRDSLGNLIRQACVQPDWRLDNDRLVLLGSDDPITEAINNTRSRALESLVSFGIWIRRHLPEDRLPEVTETLSHRLALNPDLPLTRPEHALLGMHFGNLLSLNHEWAIRERKLFFPEACEATWWCAFGSFIRFNRPSVSTFNTMRSEFEYAIGSIETLISRKNHGESLVDRLGEHLFVYYLWGLYPLTGNESLLARFYEKNNDYRQRWGKLFDYVGRSLANSDSQFDKALVDRIIAFFDWRWDAAEPLELREFTFWLEAECLDPNWRLQSYSRILDICCSKDVALSIQVNALNKLHQDHLALVLECFAKIAFDQDTQLFVSVDEARPILKAGLAAEEPQIRANAEQARDKLLRIGRFDFLDLG
jgi:hypothetical protein